MHEAIESETSGRAEHLAIALAALIAIAAAAHAFPQKAACEAPAQIAVPASVPAHMPSAIDDDLAGHD